MAIRATQAYCLSRHDFVKSIADGCFFRNFVKFLHKFCIFILAITLVAVLQMYAKELGRFEFVLYNRVFSIGGYVICLGIISFYFILFIVKSLCRGICSIFSRDKATKEEKSIKEIVNLIVSDDKDFIQLYEKTAVVDNLRVLKVALALKRNFNVKRRFEKTGMHCVDIYIIRKELQGLLNVGEIRAAITLAEDIVQNYAKEIYIIKDELLEIAVRAKKNNLAFNFEPGKFKYELTQRYINEYDIRLKLIDYETTGNADKKFEILKRLHNEYVTRVDLLCILLDFYNEYSQLGNVPYDTNWVLKTIAETISVNPNRVVATYLLQIGRNDIFELAQSMMANVSESNIEKNWILLKIAIEKRFNLQAKELAKRLIKAEELNDVRELISSHPKVIEIFLEIKNDIKL